MSLNVVLLLVISRATPSSATPRTAPPSPSSVSA